LCTSDFLNFWVLSLTNSHSNINAAKLLIKILSKAEMAKLKQIWIIDVVINQFRLETGWGVIILGSKPWALWAKLKYLKNRGILLHESGKTGEKWSFWECFSSKFYGWNSSMSHFSYFKLSIDWSWTLKYISQNPNTPPFVSTVHCRGGGTTWNTWDTSQHNFGKWATISKNIRKRSEGQMVQKLQDLKNWGNCLLPFCSNNPQSENSASF